MQCYQTQRRSSYMISMARQVSKRVEEAEVDSKEDSTLMDLEEEEERDKEDSVSNRQMKYSRISLGVEIHLPTFSMMMMTLDSLR